MHRAAVPAWCTGRPCRPGALDGRAGLCTREHSGQLLWCQRPLWPLLSLSSMRRQLPTKETAIRIQWSPALARWTVLAAAAALTGCGGNDDSTSNVSVAFSTSDPTRPPSRATATPSLTRHNCASAASRCRSPIARCVPMIATTWTCSMHRVRDTQGKRLGGGEWIGSTTSQPLGRQAESSRYRDDLSKAVALLPSDAGRPVAASLFTTQSATTDLRDAAYADPARARRHGDRRLVRAQGMGPAGRRRRGLCTVDPQAPATRGTSPSPSSSRWPRVT
jgi:hypothetical protein